VSDITVRLSVQGMIQFIRVSDYVNAIEHPHKYNFSWRWYHNVRLYYCARRVRLKLFEAFNIPARMSNSFVLYVRTVVVLLRFD
jgi:hypothetical protein